MAYHFFAEDTKMPEIETGFIENSLGYVIDSESFKEGDINVIFCSDDYLLEMNKQYLQHDYFTDIITFDYTDDKVISGDLFISLDRIKENADEFADDYVQEIYRVVIHGVLHLCGYKDHSAEEKEEMRSKENHYLSKLGKF